MYDVTSRTTFRHTTNWKGRFLRSCQSFNDEELPFLLVGNKCDNRGEKIGVNTQAGKDFAEE